MITFLNVIPDGLVFIVENNAVILHGKHNEFCCYWGNDRTELKMFTLLFEIIILNNLPLSLTSVEILSQIRSCSSLLRYSGNDLSYKLRSCSMIFTKCILKSWSSRILFIDTFIQMIWKRNLLSLYQIDWIFFIIFTLNTRNFHKFTGNFMERKKKIGIFHWKLLAEARLTCDICSDTTWRITQLTHSMWTNACIQRY